MSGRIEKLIRDYPKLKRQQRCLYYQLVDFHGISEQETIDTMYFSQPEGERVQTSGTSNKTANIALNFRERMERINDEWYEHLEKEYLELTEQLRFFESAVRSVSGITGEVLADLVFEQLTWDQVAEKHYISRRSVGNYRRKAIAEMEKLYQRYEDEIVDYMLS